MSDQTARSPEEIEAEIAVARDDLADTIDVIEDKLSPANIVAEAKERVLGLFKGADGEYDPRKLAVVAGVGLILVTYFVRRRRI